MEKNAIETYGILQAAFRPSCMNQASVLEWHKRFNEGRESVRDDEKCERSKEVRTPELIGQSVRLRVTMLRFLKEFKKRFRWKRPALFKSGQWHFHQDNSILVTDCLTKMGFKTVLQPPYRPDLVPCHFWLIPKLRFCYETIEEMEEAVTKVTDPLTQEDFDGAFQKFFGTVQQVHCIRRRLLGRGLQFHVCTINKGAHTKKSPETYSMILVQFFFKKFSFA